MLCLPSDTSSMGRVFVFLSVIVPVISFSDTKLCRSDSVSACTTFLETFLVQTSVLNLVDEDVANQRCGELNEAKECYEQLQECSHSAKEKSMQDYNKTIHKMQPLCEDKDLFKEYLGELNCLSNYYNEFEKCLPADVDRAMLQEHRNTSLAVCCLTLKAFQCATDVYARKCGRNSTDFVEKYLDDISAGIQLYNSCQVHKSTCFPEGPIPLKASTKRNSPLSYVTLFMFTLSVAGKPLFL